MEQAVLFFGKLARHLFQSATKTTLMPVLRKYALLFLLLGVLMACDNAKLDDYNNFLYWLAGVLILGYLGINEPRLQK